jgi:hypothetical protein
MDITLTPQVCTDSLTLSKAGDILTINGDAFDFTFIIEGDILPQDAVDCPLLASDVTRTGGEIILTLILPIASDASEAARFPAPILNAPDGAIEVPS